MADKPKAAERIGVVRARAAIMRADVGGLGVSFGVWGGGGRLVVTGG